MPLNKYESYFHGHFWNKTRNNYSNLDQRFQERWSDISKWHCTVLFTSFYRFTHDSRWHYMYDRVRKMTISTTKQSIYRSSRSSLNKMPFVRTSNSKIGPGTFPFYFDHIIALSKVKIGIYGNSFIGGKIIYDWHNVMCFTVSNRRHRCEDRWNVNA